MKYIIFTRFLFVVILYSHLINYLFKSGANYSLFCIIITLAYLNVDEIKQQEEI